MRQELKEKLFSDFPWLCRGIMSGKFCDIEVRDGWYPLLREMLTEIDKCFVSIFERESVFLSQVKNKFGVICAYYVIENESNFDYLRPRIDEITQKYVKLSENVCEFCGKPKGKINQPTNWSAICDDCWNERFKNELELTKIGES